MNERDFMQMAIDLAVENIANAGGPFGAVIVREGEVVATGVNRVTANNDPTAHAEVCAIRAACQKLGSFDLSGCTLYTSCEPCPMCLGAIYWAHIDKVYYGCTQHDAAEAGFDDSFIYRELERPLEERHTPIEQLMPEEASCTFRAWSLESNKTEY